MQINPHSQTDEIQNPISPADIEIPKAPGRENLQKHFKQSLPNFEDSTGFHRGSRSGGVGYSLIMWSWLAALIDSLILFSLSCFFLLSFSFLVKMNLISVLQGFGNSFFRVGIVGGISLVWIYMIMLRVFLGFTLGEWACGLRLGSLKQRLNRYYSLRVIARMTVIFVSGVFLIPILSLLAGRDLAGFLVRLPLISLDQN